jgi:prepilin signal peptidase PulO-like enzyme (type II secretory pathway)
MMVIFFIFFFGLAVGSFINVVVYRLNNPDSIPDRKKRRSGIVSLLGGRSFCDRCKHKLAWFDNLPLVSFIFLKRKCRYCRSPISWQYPLVELATGILTVLVVFFVHPRSEICRHSGGVFNLCFPGGVFITNYQLLITVIYYLLITYFLITIFVSDLLYQTIPDEISYPAMAVVFLWSVTKAGFLNAILAGLGAALFFLFLHLITSGRGMAIGDVKLAGLLGFFLGWPKIIVALYLAFLGGALIGSILILTKRQRFGQPVPFGPFLTSAALLTFFYGEKMIAFYLDFLTKL